MPLHWQLTGIIQQGHMGIVGLSQAADVTTVIFFALVVPKVFAKKTWSVYQPQICLPHISIYARGL